LFIPYELIDLAIPASTGRVKLRAVVNIRDVSSDTWVLDGRDSAAFQYDRTLGFPMGNRHPDPAEEPGAGPGPLGPPRTRPEPRADPVSR
jgi:hypothetical protein